ncbi:hypothetical protein LAZ67_2002587, partial [Cordylochernes scorpioides]
MTQLIARETEGQSGDYRFVKRLLLKRYKLSPEQFRQKFEKHDKSQEGTWRDFAFELRGFFNDWIEGMNVEDFDTLKDLSVTNQLKKKVPNVLRNHLIDDWTKRNNPDVLADKLDEYENVRTEMGPPHWNSKHTIPPSFQQKSARFPNRSEVKETEQGTNVSSREAAKNEISEKYPNTSRRMVNHAIRNDKGEPKCFNCNQFGHIARDCPVPKATLTCRGCGQTGHKERNCTRPKEGLKVANLEVEGLKTVPPDVYLKDAKIDNKETVKAMIDTGSSSCLLRESVARRINVDIEPDSTSLYGIGNQTAPAARAVGKTTVDLEIDGVVGKEIAVFIVNDDTQPYDLLIGRTWTDLPYVSFARIGKELHIGYSTEFPLANLQEEIKSRGVELRATETVQLGSDCINFASAITDEVRDGYVLFTGVDDCVNSLLEVVDGKTTVPIISVGKGNLRVKKNQCIGRVELLSPDDIVVNLDVSEDSFQTKSEEKREGQDQMKRKRPILPEDININHSLTPKERQEILDIVNEYRDCFALGMGELGCTDVTKMDIKEVDGSKLVCLRPYKTTASEREAIREIVREWKDNGIVTETRSPYASPVLLVRKITGDHRLVVDYRRLNIQTVKDKFPLPRIDDLLEGLWNAKFFTTLDLAHGYLQIPLTDKAKLKTAFITPDDTGQFERMIFGLANAPAEFQRLMHTVLGPLLNKKAFCYLEDVIIPAKDWREMIERLREVLERIRSAKLTLKPSKCEFRRREVEFLGYVISTGGLKPGPRKIKAIEEFPEPKNIHDIRRFLGLTNFFRRFVKDFARKAEPLSKLTKKGTQFEWKEEQRKSFGGLRNDLVEYPHSDPELRDLIQIFRKDPCDRTVGEQNRINDYSYKGGRLFCTDFSVKNGEEERALYVIPKSMRKSLVVKFHDLMGYFAVDRTVNKIKELYWFPSMKRYVRRHVARCVECLFNKVPGGKQQGFLHPIKPGKRPFSIVHMDHVGPFVKSTRGNQELLVIVDNLTRFVRLSPVRNTSTQNILKVMKSFVNDFGLPDKIISDRGSCFTSRKFEEFCRGNGIHHTLNSTKHPQGNGMVERVNRTVLSTIATGIKDPRRKDWDLKIKEVERDLNNAVNKTTNKTPFETLHGYSPRFHDGILKRLADEDMDPWTEPERIQESVRTQIENKQEIMKTYYDKKKCRTLQFEATVGVRRIQDVQKVLLSSDKEIIDILAEDDEADLEKEMDDCAHYQEIIIEAIVAYEDAQKQVAKKVVVQDYFLDTTEKIRLPTIELPKFSGNLIDWLTFWAQFEKIHLDIRLKDSDKFYYLLQSLSVDTEAYKIVSIYPLTEENYSKAIDALRRRYANPDLLLQSLNLESAGPDTWLYPLVESCLSDELLLTWQRRSQFIKLDVEHQTRLDQLMDFLEREILIQQNIQLAKDGFQIAETSDQERKKGFNKKKNDIPTVTGLQQTVLGGCIFCEKKHASQNCFAAKKMSLEEKRKVIREKKVCFKCLKGRHLARYCRTRVRVKQRVSHRENSESFDATVKPNEDLKKHNDCSNHVCQRNVALQTLMLNVIAPKGTKLVRAFFDSGSQHTYILKTTAEELGLKPVTKEIVHHALFGGIQTTAVTHNLYDVQLKADDENFVCKVTVRDQSKICQALPRIPKTSLISKELEQRKINVTDHGNDNPPIELLISADIYGKLMTGKTLQLDSGLTAMLTHFGWTLLGSLKEWSGEENSMLVMSMNTMFGDSRQDFSISQLWDLDTIGVRDPVEVKSSVEQETAFKNEFLKNISRNKDGRYVVPLPWIEGHPPLPTNEIAAHKRLVSTTRKLKTSSKYDKYDYLFKEWEREGLIENVNNAKPTEIVHYLPHRPVYKESASTPVRPVFDASCKIDKHPSLNDCLWTGSNCVKKIMELLLRFREKRIGFTADIRRAFQTIEVREEDRDAMRFLWWQNQYKNQVQVYRHTRVMFGATCSPFILGTVLEYHLTHMNIEDSKIAEKLLNSFYIDNSIGSEDSLESYLAFKEKSIQLLRNAKMDLRMWQSNAKEFQHDTEAITMILGVRWDRRRDLLFIDTSKIDLPSEVTKRTILPTVQRIFDPFSILGPALIPMKSLLQRTWIQKIKWDTLIIGAEKRSFEDWCKNIPLLTQLKFPRAMIKDEIDKRSWSLHLFTDASRTAYSAVVFLRVENEEIQVSFMSAKTRVTPMKREILKKNKKTGESEMIVKEISIPRLELLTCLIGSRLLSTVKRSLNITDLKEFYWTDSTAVLAWIKREEIWNTFVGNRIREIRELTLPNNWRHIQEKNVLRTCKKTSTYVFPRDAAERDLGCTETFDFSTPNEWPKWRKRFERYLVVSGMKKKEEADKIDLFMYLMGDRADDIFRTFKFEKEEEATKVDSVLKAFDSHFCVRKNIIYERAKFNSRIQEDREPVDEFITSLYKLADSCEFEGLHEQLIRDRIVVGVRDKALSERMQLDSELTLEKAVKMVRQQEAVRQQQVDLQRPLTSQKVNQVKFNSKKQSPKQQQQPSRKKEKSAKTRSRCPKCGGFTHREGQACRAEGQKCNLCSKTGHFANCCPDKQAKTAEVKAVSELDEEIDFLLEVSAVEDSSNLDGDEGECRRRWTAEIQVNGKKVKFKLDSQADVTCVPLCLFKKIMGQQRLVESDINLRAAEFSELQTVGMFISTLRNGSYEIKEKIYVIRRLSEPLLSRRACELLNLARRIEVVATRINSIKEFPEVFEGLGQIGNPYEIKLKPGAKPYAVHTPRRVPIPLMEKLKTRLEELEKAGIIAQVNVATEWCAPTVIAGKPNGDIRLCVDLSRLNEHVQREVHPMPVVEHMLGQLGEARFFSKLDANSGFHQIPLSPDCQHLTTFITPFGRCKYCRMPFGISLAPEYFQRVMSIILQGMDGVMCYLDDILIFASDSKTHDRILRLVLRKLKEAKVTLNKAKCVFGVPRINFLGHILDEDGIRPDPAKIEAVAEMPAPTDVHGVRRFLGMVNHLGHKRRTTLPIAPGNLNPKLVDSQTLKRKEGRRRKDMKSRYDRRCGATDMEELSEGDTVWITDMRTWGIVKQKASTPRSYMVDTPVGTLRRNRFHLRKGVTVQYPADPSTPTFSGEELVENEKTPVVDYPSNDSEDGQIRTRSGRIVKPSRIAVKRVVRQCVTCRKLTAKSVITEEAPLPKERIMTTNVFEIIGVDLTGPLYLKGQAKVWTVIYTCSVYRAVHLDLVNSLSTKAFIQSLERFIRIYGCPTMIFSDNGRNFVGTDNFFQQIDWKKLQESDCVEPIQWRFNPPFAAWWGGWWERLIRSMKNLLKRTLGKATLRKEQLVKMLEEVQSIMNGRPLTYISEEMEDPQPLTPAMFLRHKGNIKFREGDLTEKDRLQFSYAWRKSLERELKKSLSIRVKDGCGLPELLAKSLISDLAGSSSTIAYVMIPLTWKPFGSKECPRMVSNLAE